MDRGGRELQHGHLPCRLEVDVDSLKPRRHPPDLPSFPLASQGNSSPPLLPTTKNSIADGQVGEV